MSNFRIVSAGVGSPELLTFEARNAIADAERVLADKRLAAAFSGLRTNTQTDIEPCAFSDLAERASAIALELASFGASGIIAILVSGDAGFYSAAKTLRVKLESLGEVSTISGVGSLQYFCALLNTSWDDAELISLHGKSGSECDALLGTVSYRPKVFALTGGNDSPGSICERLTLAGLGGVNVTTGENLGSADEKVKFGVASDFFGANGSDLAVMLIENVSFVNPAISPDDGDFQRGDIPMTKAEVRRLAAVKLQIEPTSVVWDIGAGSGSCSAAFARLANRGSVFAVERDSDALSLIDVNRRKTGAFNVQIISGEAPAALAGLPRPDCVFIGGSGGNLSAIIGLCKAANASVRIVITAVTLETLNEAVAAMEAAFDNIEVVQISVTETRRAGRYHMARAQNPVWVISA
jgi:precorrin-6Y C5,15-methyltransferase (decarboxylating)